MIWILGALGLVLGSSIGWQVGVHYFNQIGLYAAIITAACGLLGAVLLPWGLRVAASRMGRRLQRIPQVRLNAMLIGAFLGLTAAAFLALPLSLLPSPWGLILPCILALPAAYVGATSLQMAPPFLAGGPRRRLSQAGGENRTDQHVLLDTSVIIDGRIADISRTGFIGGTMLKLISWYDNEWAYSVRTADMAVMLAKSL